MAPSASDSLGAMAESPEITVVVPTRNRWHFLRATLESALAQEGVELEVIVVDDGSTDETQARLGEIADPRLRTVRHDVARGVAPARNHGIAEARGEWIAFLDDDDLWAPGKLAMQLAVARERAAGFVYCGAAHFDETGAVLWIEPAPATEMLGQQLRTGNVIPAGASNVIARASAVRQAGGFDESFFHVADWDLWLRLADKVPAAASAEIAVGYRKHAHNMLTERGQDAMREFDRLAAKHPHPDGNWRQGGVALARWLGQNHLRAGRRADAARCFLRGALVYRSRRCALLAAGAVVDPRAVRRALRPEPGAADAAPGWLIALMSAPADS